MMNSTFLRKGSGSISLSFPHDAMMNPTMSLLSFSVFYHEEKGDFPYQRTNNDEGHILRNERSTIHLHCLLYCRLSVPIVLSIYLG